MRRLLLAITPLLALPLLGLPAWIALHRSDLPAVDDADMRLQPRDVAPEDDAFHWFGAAGDAVSWSDDTDVFALLRALRNGEETEVGSVAELARENTEAFRLLERGLSAPDIRIPAFSLDPGAYDTVGVLLPLQALVRIAADEALLAARRGPTSESIERALLGMRIGRKLGSAREIQMLELMVAATAQRTSLGAMVDLAARGHLGREDLAFLARRLGELRWDEKAWERAWAAEYRFVERSLSEVFDAPQPGDAGNQEQSLPGRMAGWLPDDYRFHRNRTLSLLADEYRILQANSHRDCALSEPAATEMTLLDAKPTLGLALRNLLTPNYAGRVAVRAGVPNLWRFDTRRCHLETQIALVQGLLATAAYHSEQGRLPDRLDDLVPTYLDAVPRDRFDGQPLRWSPESGVLYSIGADLIDRGPPPEPALSNEAVPSVHVPSGRMPARAS